MEPSGYTPEQIEQWRGQLEHLAQQPRTRFTKRQAVEALIEPIQQALAVHSYIEVAQQLQQWGLDIKPGSLKQYVTSYVREQKTAISGKGDRKRKKQTASSSQQQLRRESEGESNRKSQVNSPNPDSTPTVNPNPFDSGTGQGEVSIPAPVNLANGDVQELTDFDLAAELSAIADREDVNGADHNPQPNQWVEPKFNRNRVRPPR